MNGFPHQKNKVDKGFPMSPRHLLENLLTWALLKDSFCKRNWDPKQVIIAQGLKLQS